MRAEDAEKFYTEVVDQKMGSDYEGERWHKDARASALYGMTKDTITTFVTKKKTISWESCLELGAGAATWTKELIAERPDASYDFVDISSVMLAKAKTALAPYALRARFFVSDFNAFVPDRGYDFFFSIRALEYVADKDEAMQKIASLLVSGGYGFIITKTPHYVRAALRGRTYSALHQGQITPQTLKKLCLDAGLSEATVYPVTFTLPFFPSARASKILYALFGKRSLSMVSQFFSESYAISFKKP